MEVRYDKCRDITLKLREEEIKKLLSGPTEYFFDMHNPKNIDPKTGEDHSLLTGISKESKTKFFLGYCSDKGGLFENAVRIDNNFGKILIPDASELKWPWLINLSEQGVEYFKIGWPMGILYKENSKLIIVGE